MQQCMLMLFTDCLMGKQVSGALRVDANIAWFISGNAGVAGFRTSQKRVPLHIEAQDDRRWRLKLATSESEVRIRSLGWPLAYSGGLFRMPKRLFLATTAVRVHAPVANWVYVHRDKWANQNRQGRHGLQEMESLVFITTAIITWRLGMGRIYQRVIVTYQQHLVGSQGSPISKCVCCLHLVRRD